MRIFDETEGMKWMHVAAEVGKQATCGRSKCGSVIVNDGEIIGEGWNSPTGNFESQRRCDIEKSSYHRKVTDKTCCVHAEERAIMDALRRNPGKLAGSMLYFIRLNDDGKPKFSGQPYCTICSKLALDAGVAEFVLWHESGITAYPTDEYNDLSYDFFEERTGSDK
jgi:deoxycytidylate deaminase